MRTNLILAIDRGDKEKILAALKAFRNAKIPDPKNICERAERELAIIRARKGPQKILRCTIGAHVVNSCGRTLDRMINKSLFSNYCRHHFNPKN